VIVKSRKKLKINIYWILCFKLF